MSVPLPFDGPEGPLSGRVESALADLDGTDPARHPEVLEAVNRSLLAELEQLEDL